MGSKRYKYITLKVLFYEMNEVQDAYRQWKWKSAVSEKFAGTLKIDIKKTYLKV